MTSSPTQDSVAAPTRSIASASVLGGALCLSMSAVLVKIAGIDAGTTAMLRCAIAVIVLVPLAMWERARHGALSWHGVGWAIAAGVALGVDYAAWTAAIYHVGAGISTVLINVQVIVLPLLALVVDREPITRRFILALPLMILGITLVGGIWEGKGSAGHAVAGTVLGVLAGFGYGVYLFLTRRATRREPNRMVQPLTWATASAAVMTTLIAQFTGGLHVTGITPRSWLLLIILALVGQVIAWLLVHHGSIRLEAATAATLLLIQPVLALVLSALILDEHPTAVQLLGAAVVITAVAVSNGIVTRYRRTRRDNGGPASMQ